MLDTTGATHTVACGRTCCAYTIAHFHTIGVISAPVLAGTALVSFLTGPFGLAVLGTVSALLMTYSFFKHKGQTDVLNRIKVSL